MPVFPQHHGGFPKDNRRLKKFFAQLFLIASQIRPCVWAPPSAKREETAGAYALATGSWTSRLKWREREPGYAIALGTLLHFAQMYYNYYKMKYI